MPSSGYGERLRRGHALDTDHDLYDVKLGASLPRLAITARRSSSGRCFHQNCLKGSTMTPGPTWDRRERKRQLTHRTITVAGQDLFSQHGFGNTSVAMIAERADVAEATVYNHFPNKEAVFFEGRCPWVQLISELQQQANPQSTRTTADRLVEVIELVCDVMSAHLDRMSAPERQSTLRALTQEEPLRRWEAALQRQTEEALAHHVTGHQGLSARDARRWAALAVAETRLHIEAHRQAMLASQARVQAANDSRAALAQQLLRLQTHVLTSSPVPVARSSQAAEGCTG
jgi:AcrR family transcriptional regulator